MEHLQWCNSRNACEKCGLAPYPTRPRPLRMTSQRSDMRILAGNCRGGNSGGGDEGLDQEHQTAVRRAEGSADAVSGAAAQLHWGVGHGRGGDDVRRGGADGGGAVLERHRRARAKEDGKIAAGTWAGETSQP